MTPHLPSGHLPSGHLPSGRPDPTSPWVFSTRELGRRAGAMRSVHRDVPAPPDDERIGLDVIGVPAGATISLDVRLESVTEGVYVSGTVSAPLTGECSRCLDPSMHRTLGARFEPSTQLLAARGIATPSGLHPRLAPAFPRNSAARSDTADGPARCCFRWKRPSPASSRRR